MDKFNAIDGEFPDIWDWISALPPPSNWQGDAMSLNLCKFSGISLLLSAIKKPALQSKDHLVTFSLLADFQFSIPLWTSEPCTLHPTSKHKALYCLFLSFIQGILFYGPQKSVSKIKAHIDSGAVVGSKHFKDMFNCAYLCLAFCVCFYEAPEDIRPWCVEAVEGEIEKVAKHGESTKVLVQALGSYIEEHFLRSMALLLTNLMHYGTRERSNIFVQFPYSYSSSASGLWKVRVYMPVVAMKTVDKHYSAKDDALLIALGYLHLEAVLQFSYELLFTPNWIEVRVRVDNVRCDVVPLSLEDTTMKEGEDTSEEKHFPSRVSIWVAPPAAQESNLLAVSLNMSSANPLYEISNERSIEVGLEPPNSYGALKFGMTEGSMMSMTPWKLEQSVEGNRGTFDWILYDTLTAKQVFSTKPSKVEWLQPRAWFKDRYSHAFRPFTRQGGVVFAGDMYSECISWKVKPEMEGQIMKWEVGGSIWITYWPNKYRTLYCETKCFDFSQLVDLPLLRSAH